MVSGSFFSSRAQLALRDATECLIDTIATIALVLLDRDTVLYAKRRC